MNHEIQGDFNTMMNLFPCGLIWTSYTQVNAKENKLPKFALANEAFYQLVGIKKDEFEKKFENRIGLLLVAEDELKLKQTYEAVYKSRTPESVMFTINTPADGPISVTSNVAVSTGDGNSVTILTVIQDITAARRKELDLEQQIKMDLMTGLYNKVSAESIIREKIIEHKTGVMGLLMIDIDNFKTINDTFGHMFGDVVIRDIAENITASFPADTIIGRIGGDEFLIFIDDVDEGVLVEELDALCSKISYEYLADSGLLTVTCSVGYTLSKGEEDEFDGMFVQADTAMYVSKENGKSKYSKYLSNMQNMRKKVTRKRMHTEDFYDARVYDMEFVSSAYSLLSDSKYIESSITMLLRKITERYELYGVNVFEHDSNGGRYYRGNNWSEDKRIDLEEVDACISNQWLVEQFGQKNVFAVSDVRQITGEAATVMKERNYPAFVFCKMPAGHNVDGCVCMTARTMEREWTEFELDTFEELAKAVSIFVSLDKERLKEKAKIEQMSITDQLTGLLTKKSFESRLNEYLKKDKRRKTAAVIYMDISNFSYINEKYGYEAGDEVLRIISKVIKSQTRMILAARAYSDCFLILRDNISPEAIVLDADYMISVILRVLARKYSALSIQMKVGIYTLQPEDHYAYLAVENANMARKSMKGNNIASIGIYKEEMRKMRDVSQKITAELLQVLHEDELKLYIQPKFSLQSREVIGLEAFARWYTPQGVLRKPSEFVTALAATGYITQLDFAVYEKVLQTLERWKKNGGKPYVFSINFSMNNSIGEDFVRRIVQMAKQYDIDPKWIEIEVSAYEIEQKWEAVVRTLKALRKYGFRTAIDNFGAGYASMKLILNTWFDVVKIDRSFLAESTDEYERKSYMKYINALVHSPRQQIVFVGAETKEQADELVECGYDSVQGYLFERVIPLEKFEQEYGEGK